MAKTLTVRGAPNQFDPDSGMTLNKPVVQPETVQWNGECQHRFPFKCPAIFCLAICLLIFGIFTPLGLRAAEPVESLPDFKIQSIFDSKSTPAEQIQEIAILATSICAVIFFVVSGLIAWSVWKYRVRDTGDPKEDLREPPQIYGSNQIEMAWTVLPILIVFVLILVTARTVGQIQNMEMPENALRIRVVGHQWWWEVQYPDYGFTTANEIHIPVSKPGEPRITHITLESADVIHSFWVPKLAGKTDLVPNKINHTWVEPKETGVYFGNCAEYCGLQHANMLLRVFVREPAEFERWAQNQKAPPAVDLAVSAGREAFLTTSCVNCHTVGDSVAKGVFGPDLSHFASRQTLGAGAAELTRDNLRTWLKDPALIKPGALMPDMQLTPQEIDDIADYLLTLK